MSAAGIASQDRKLPFSGYLQAPLEHVRVEIDAIYGTILFAYRGPEADLIRCGALTKKLARSGNQDLDADGHPCRIGRRRGRPALNLATEETV